MKDEGKVHFKEEESQAKLILKKQMKKKPAKGNEGKQPSPQSSAKKNDDKIEDVPPQIVSPEPEPELNSSEDEGIEDYKSGGYHFTHVGEIFLNRYIVLQKLGWGHFSTVWLAKDVKYDTFVALKIQKSAVHYLEAAYDEVEILEQVSSYWMKEEWKKSAKNYFHLTDEKTINRDSCYCVQLLNSFLHYGPNGKHFVMVFEIMGVNLLEIMKRYNYKGIPIPIVRRIARQILIGLDYLHRICHIIHTDLKPENVLVCLTEEEILQIKKKSMLGNKNVYKIPVFLVREPEIIKVDEAKKESNTVNEKVLTKNQKKKHKKKKRKDKLKGNVPEVKKEESKEKANKEEYKSVNNQPLTATPVIKDNLVDVDENYLEELGIERPRSMSLPALIYNEEENMHILEFDGQSFSMQIVEYFKNRSFAIKKKIEDIEKARFGIPVTKPVVEEEANLPDKKPVKKVDKNIKVKIVDLGNGCWDYHHFTSKIQTRQYRSPEVILGSQYGTSADVWSFACMIYELITGDFLFDPRKGENFKKDDDQLALMVELMGPMPKNFAFESKNFERFLQKKGRFQRIHDLKYWPLKDVLIEKYRFKEQEAQGLADFLLPMISWYPEKRAPTKEMINHYWLDMPDEEETKMNEKEYRSYLLKTKTAQDPEASNISKIWCESEDEDYKADYESNDDNIDNEIDSDDISTIDSNNKKYSLDSNLLNNDHGPNPQFIKIIRSK